MFWVNILLVILYKQTSITDDSINYLLLTPSANNCRQSTDTVRQAPAWLGAVPTTRVSLSTFFMICATDTWYIPEQWVGCLITCHIIAPLVSSSVGRYLPVKPTIVGE